ncbi:hypothetical protein [Paludibaculum fermentans]|uniref:Uncharacterized protein n=1 Tax=Paludibaculum fermentans TaxID=1473598 RepID=A0A7S7NUP3_PALFE|nr:hypothetical protein [Paludibaculum fermentans]QOY90166.1 hypothetical protein IRI77_09495 [Paludibaculum fermentans]
MPAPTPARLSLLTFPQRWSDGTVRVRFLCLPKGDPNEALAAGQPAFAAANLVFTAQLIDHPDSLPQAADAEPVGPLVLEPEPLNKAALLAALRGEFRIVPRPVAVGAAAPSFRKPVTDSYRALTGNREMSRFMASADDFDCALHEAQGSQPALPIELDDSVTWGRIVAMVLKQPALAEACGFIGQATVTVPDPARLAKGGWLYIDLDASSDYFGAAAGFRSVYAARLPALNENRTLYAAVLFPVDGADPADDVYREAERYSAGFSRMVHCAQTDDGGDAIRLAWDDEQVAEWLNRQVNPAFTAPMGTAGYRVDVRRRGDDAWNSLQQIASVGDLTVGAERIGPFAGDAVVEVAPVQISPALAGQYWMPPYFATWRGSSLALTDQDLVELHQHPLLDDPAAQAHKLGRDKVFVPVADKAVPLRYGATYEFRVRLADLTRGGPVAEDVVALPADSITSIAFRRRRRPGQIHVLARPSKDSPSIQIAKPRLGYPEALFTGDATFADLKNDFGTAPEREFGVPDPDVLQVGILVEVRALAGDEAQWLPLYSTRRPFDADEIAIPVKAEDHATLAAFAELQPDNGPLAIPTARAIRLTLTAIGRDDADYFEPEAARVGLPITIELRAEAVAEQPLFSALDLPLRGFFFQPPPADGTVANPLERMAQELGLNHSRVTITGRPGHRTIFSASSELQHTLGSEASAITFASNADAVGRWVNAVKFTVARDWTWDGLANGRFEVRRIVKQPNRADVERLAGQVVLPRSLAQQARTGVATGPRAAQRQFTDIFFFDAFDPKPAAGEFPAELRFEYRIEAAFQGGAPAPAPEILPELLLPVTTQPVQVPKLVSAGIALSEYVPADDYSSTNQRVRSLWVEFEEAPNDPDDAYFVRILADAPDPMLTLEVFPETVETPLPLDPEWMRLIVPGQPRDNNGLNAMGGLAQNTPDGRHWIVPLPEGLGSSSPELFGMYTYEIRLGHTEARWCTAQGRHGPALRVAGVQHPAPPLACQAARTERAVRVRASFATPVYKGRNVRPQVPRTQLWAVLYARVRQTDGKAWRNLLLTHLTLPPPAALFNAGPEGNAAVLFGEGEVEIGTVRQMLRRVGLPEDAPLTVLAVECFGGVQDVNPAPDPVGADLGFARMLRVSPLVPVPDAC